MRPIRRLLASFILVLALSACQPREDAAKAPAALTSAAPLFRAYGAAPLKLKAGIWREINKNCPVDEAQPIALWPDCANYVRIAQGRMAGRFDTRSEEYVLAASTPPVMQIREGDQYFYALIAYAAPDEAGEIKSFDRQLIGCGETCEARDGAAVLNAAQAGRTVQVDKFYWVRDGDS